LLFIFQTRPNVLNLSYVITSSVDFHGTLERVVNGLNHAGFSGKDYHAQDDAPPEEKPAAPQGVQIGIDTMERTEDDVPAVDTAALRERIQPVLEKEDVETVPEIETDGLFAEALAQKEAYEAEIENAGETAFELAPMEVRDKMNVFRMNEEFREEAERLRFPQFMQKVGTSFFSDEYVKLKLNHLTPGFSLKDKDVEIEKLYQ